MEDSDGLKTVQTVEASEDCGRRIPQGMSKAILQGNLNDSPRDPSGAELRLEACIAFLKGFKRFLKDLTGFKGF